MEKSPHFEGETSRTVQRAMEFFEIERNRFDWFWYGFFKPRGEETQGGLVFPDDINKDCSLKIMNIMKIRISLEKK